MKGALACYVEAVRALPDAGVRACAATCMIAAVCGEIEKAQWGEAQGARVPRLRGRVALPRHRTAASPTCASSASRPSRRSCSATSARSGCGSRHAGNFIHTAFSEGKRGQNSILRMREVLECGARVDPVAGRAIPANAYERRPGGRRRERDRRAGSAGASPAPRTAPTSSSTFACRRRSRWPSRAARGARQWCASLAGRFPDYGVEARGLRDRARRRDRGRRTRSIAAIDAASRGGLRRRRPSATVTRWFSDASALTRAGIADRQLRHLDAACSTRPTARTSTICAASWSTRARSTLWRR